jgi:hypothetical protein
MQPLQSTPLFPVYRPNKNKNAIIRPNSAIASTKANPRIVYVNNVLRSKGFLLRAIRKAPKTLPIPTPAPIREIDARPAAIIFAAFKIICFVLLNEILTVLFKASLR